MNLDNIWEQIDIARNCAGMEYGIRSVNSAFCKSCDRETGITTKDDIVCEECGLVICSNISHSYSKYVDEQKRNYTLHSFVKDKCEKLSIPYVSLLFELISTVYSKTTSRRSKMRDAIFVVCAFNICKIHGMDRSMEDLITKTLGEGNNSEFKKYVSKAEKLFSEIMSTSNIPIFKEFLKIDRNTTKTYFYKHLNEIATVFVLNKEDIDKIGKIIDKCEELSILSVSSPKSIVVGCVYFYITQSGRCQITKGKVARVISEIFSCNEGTVKRIGKEIEKYT
jgi:transcription initiation factor TFIIIB Brf1 subunit/transcription initiation factor TFIIB